MRCLYLQCTTVAVEDPDEANKAFALVYPGDAVDLADSLGAGQKRFYRATPLARVAEQSVRARAHTHNDQNAR